MKISSNVEKKHIRSNRDYYVYRFEFGIIADFQEEIYFHEYLTCSPFHQKKTFFFQGTMLKSIIKVGISY